MITTRSNEQGFIYAYIEWEVVDEETKMVKDGKYFYIEDMWIHPEYRNKGIIQDIIKELFFDKRTQSVEYYFYRREKYGRLSGIIPASKFIKRILAKV